MSRFAIPVDLAKRKRQKIWGFVCLGMALIYIVLFLLDWINNDTSASVSFSWMRIVFFLMMLIGGLPLLIGPKPFYIDINNHRVMFRKKIGNAGEESTLLWNDIRWIKLETDISISFFHDSSFNENVPLQEFSKEDQRKILNELERTAIPLKVKTVNFSLVPQSDT